VFILIFIFLLLSYWTGIYQLPLFVLCVSPIHLVFSKKSLFLNDLKLIKEGDYISASKNYSPEPEDYQSLGIVVSVKKDEKNWLVTAENNSQIEQYTAADVKIERLV
jgi:hypothetical protein